MYLSLCGKSMWLHHAFVKIQWLLDFQCSCLYPPSSWLRVWQWNIFFDSALKKIMREEIHYWWACIINTDLWKNCGYHMVKIRSWWYSYFAIGPAFWLGNLDFIMWKHGDSLKLIGCYLRKTIVVKIVAAWRYYVKKMWFYSNLAVLSIIEPHFYHKY